MLPILEERSMANDHDLLDPLWELSSAASLKIPASLGAFHIQRLLSVRGVQPSREWVGAQLCGGTTEAGLSQVFSQWLIPTSLQQANLRAAEAASLEPNL